LKMWNGKLQLEFLSVEQQGYAAAEPLEYPEDMELIDCALGTNPLGDSPAVRAALAAAGDISVSGYPEPEPEKLKEAISSKFHTWRAAPENIIVGGGSMGVLVTLWRLMLGPGAAFSGLSPQFTDGILQALYTGAEYNPVHLRGPRFPITGGELSRLLEGSPAAVYLDRPNNPTGQAVSLGLLEELAREAARKGVWVVVDEAYGDFLPDDESAASLNLPNVVTCRSFSKGRGGAGLRVGFAVCRNRELAAACRKLQPPFIVGTVDSRLAEVLLTDDAFIDETRRYAAEAKSKMCEALSGKKDIAMADTHPKVPIALITCKEGDMAAKLADLGISCESGRGFFDLDERSARVRIPSPGQLEEFLRRISEI
jgi:histidinol-phosphate aminotransferase